MEITEKSYKEEINKILKDIIEESLYELEIKDNFLKQRDLIEEYVYENLYTTIDSHRWIIYYCYNLDIIINSEYIDYFYDNFGDEAVIEILKKGGVKDLLKNISYWCMYCDCIENLDYILDNFEEDLDEEDLDEEDQDEEDLDEEDLDEEDLDEEDLNEQ